MRVKERGEVEERPFSLYYVRVNGGHNCPLQLLLRPPYVASCQGGQAEAPQDV